MVTEESNALSAMTQFGLGIVTVDKLVFRNAFSRIELTDFGIVTLFNPDP